MILVTGGAGYIGSHCVLKLLEKNYKVLVFDNLSNGNIQIINILKQFGKSDFDFVKGDLLNLDELEALFKNKNIDAIIHFAALSQVADSVINPSIYYKNNVVGTLNLLDTMRKFNVDKIVFSSTAAVYGEPIEIPINENHPQNPINPYGKTKLTIEKIMDDYYNAYNLKSVRLRYFNVVGADNKCRIGEWHNPETHLIPNILKSTFDNGKVFELYGTDYNTKDGSCIRDYIDVEDLVEAHILALEYLKNNGKTDFFNLGTSEGSTVKEVFKLCEKIAEKEIPVKIMERRKGDPAKLVADNTKAKEILNWKIKKTLEDSIKSAFEWEKILNRGIK